jgi:3-phosphoshikimate 1-carboxyvinyltransferase
MKVEITTSKLTGKIDAPASKSSMQRACAAALLFRGETVIRNPGNSNDDRAAIEIIQKLGAVITRRDSKILVKSDGLKPVADTLDCGESGLSIRMFTPIAALSDHELTITGSGSLLSRPMDFFDEILPKLGVSIKSNEGKLPLKIKGPLKPADIEVDGSLSSQFLTGLLMAYSAAGASEVTLRVKNLKSKPYIDLTLDVMKQFGMSVPENKNYEEFYFPRVNEATEAKKNIEYTVEGDWSGAAFLLVAAAIAGPVLIHGLDLTSPQADKAIVDAMMQASAGIAIEAKGIRVQPSKMKAFAFDATDCPDLFPPLVALAAYCEGHTVIKGVSRLTHKESDRGKTLQEEFGKMGLEIVLNDDNMLVKGGEGLKGAVLHSHHDHRIAMALAIAALQAKGETIIHEAGAVKKSYPDFYTDLQSMGASLSLPSSTFKINLEP